MKTVLSLRLNVGGQFSQNSIENKRKCFLRVCLVKSTEVWRRLMPRGERGRFESQFRVRIQIILFTFILFMLNANSSSISQLGVKDSLRLNFSLCIRSKVFCDSSFRFFRPFPPQTGNERTAVEIIFCLFTRGNKINRICLLTFALKHVKAKNSKIFFCVRWFCFAICGLGPIFRLSSDEMMNDVKSCAHSSLLIFDLNSDTLIYQACNSRMCLRYVSFPSSSSFR